MVLLPCEQCWVHVDWALAVDLDDSGSGVWFCGLHQPFLQFLRRNADLAGLCSVSAPCRIDFKLFGLLPQTLAVERGRDFAAIFSAWQDVPKEILGQALWSLSRIGLEGPEHFDRCSSVPQVSFPDHFLIVSRGGTTNMNVSGGFGCAVEWRHGLSWRLWVPCIPYQNFGTECCGETTPHCGIDPLVLASFMVTSPCGKVLELGCIDLVYQFL